MEVLENYVFEHKCTNLILDLRDNQGGLVHIAADILNQLVQEKDVLLFRTSGRQVISKEYKSLGKPFFKFSNYYWNSKFWKRNHSGTIQFS